MHYDIQNLLIVTITCKILVLKNTPRSSSSPLPFSLSNPEVEDETFSVEKDQYVEPENVTVHVTLAFVRSALQISSAQRMEHGTQRCPSVSG